MTIKKISEATPEEAQFLEQAAQRMSTSKVLEDGYHCGGFETLWEVWDRIDMMWLSGDGLSVVFTYDDSFSVAVIQISGCFENESMAFDGVLQDRFAGCFTQLAD